MFFLNLTGPEFVALLSALGGLITALYLLDRAKHRKIVSTLQFWVDAGAAEQRQARRKMHDPWSLVLQLASLLLLLLAISRMQWGNREVRGHNHVLLLDAGSWTAAQTPAGASGGSVLDQEKEQARRYLDVLPQRDRVMLVAADGLATPLTRFTADRRQLDSALRDIKPGFSALNIEAALLFARQAQGWPGGAAGEIVYIGPRLSERDVAVRGSPNLRIIDVDADRENCGILQLAAQQIEDEPNTWQSLIRIKNYGMHSRSLRLDVNYGGTGFAPRHLFVPAGQEITAQYTFTTRAPGELTASISPGGSLASDDRASVFLPQGEILRVVVYTDRPQILRPLLEANHELKAVFYTPAQYSAKPNASVVILDRFDPATPPEVPGLWIDPPKDRSPLPVKSSVTDALVTWNSGSALGLALRAKALRVPGANIFQLFEGDAAVASAPEGAVAVVRTGQSKPKTAVIGFDPAAGELRYEVATPLLFADLLQWLDPMAFRTLALTAEQIGLVSLRLDSAEQRSPLQVTGDRGAAIPFTRHGDALQIFVTRPTTARIASVDRERVIELRLPSVGDQIWRAPSGATNGLPALTSFTPAARDLWKWLALAGGAGLLLEWVLFGASPAIAEREQTGTPKIQRRGSRA